MRFALPGRLPDLSKMALLLLAGSLAWGCTLIPLDTSTSIPEHRSVYPEVLVALYVPSEIAQQNPVFALPEGTYSTDGEKLPRTILVDQAFALGLARVVEAYFPQVTLYREPPPPASYDLLIRASLTAEVDSKEWKQGLALEVKLRGSLDIVGKDGRLLDQTAVEGRGYHGIENLSVRESTKGIFVWHSEGGFNTTRNLFELGRIVGDEALRSVLRQFVAHLSQSLPLAQHLAAFREERAQPSDLVAVVHFEDGGGLLPNQRLDAGETGELVVRLENRGPGAAYAVTVDVSSATLELKAPAALSLGDIPVGETREIRLPLEGGLKLADGHSPLLVEAREKRGYHARKVLLELPTVRLVRPMLQVTDILLNDSTGKAEGDGDGNPGNGEVLEATIFVRNAGPGDAGDVGVLLSASSPQVEILESSPRLGSIPAGQLREIRFLVRLPFAATIRDLELQATAVEGRGEQISQGQLTRAWPVLSRWPALELDWRIFDGTSPASAGNRDGRVNNGERVEVLLFAANRGQVDAREIRLDIASEQAGVSVQPLRIDLPNLPAGTEAAPVPLLLDISRTFSGERIVLRTAVQQKDFPTKEHEISLPVARHLPSLTADIPGSPALQQGERRQLQVQLENRGLLEARDVEVKIRTRWPSLEILGKETISLGNLRPGSTAPPVALDLFAKRSAPAGAATLELTIQQADFPPSVQEISLEVTAESPVRFDASPEVPHSLRGRPTKSSGEPVIVFHKYETGQIVADEDVTLAFEIYDEVGLAHVGVAQNGRPLRLTPPSTSSAAESNAGRRRQVTRYTLPVKLDLGANVIEVTALSFDGGSRTRSLELTRNAREGQIWAAVIGVSRYQELALDLQYADTDAEAFESYLRNELGVPNDHIRLLKNEQATRRRVIEAIGDWLPERSDVNDTVFIYFAGHGARDEAAGSTDGLDKFLLPSDATTASYNSTSINFEELKRQLDRIRAARIILVLDTCFSGAAAGGRTVFDGSSRTRGVLTEEFLVELTGNGKGTVLLMASGVNELAYEPPELGHGVFTYFLLEGLRGRADAHPYGNSDGLISVDEIYLYTSRRVREKTRNSQNPQKFGGGSGEIILGRTRSGERR